MLGTAFESAKNVAKLASDYKHMDLFQKAVELMAQVTELAQENFELKKRVAELEQQIDHKAKLFFHENAYWQRDNANRKDDGPFCSACFDTSGKLVRMHVYHPMPGTEFLDCPVCKKK